jgi:hypothetical protein
MNNENSKRRETILEILNILETSDYIDTAEHLYDGIKYIKRNITEETIHDFLRALENPTVIDIDGKVKVCINKLKSYIENEKNKKIEVYE